MSNGRRIRRGLRKGPRAYVLPAIPEDVSAELKDALAIRNAASVSGRCACSAEGVITGPDEDGIHHMRFEHEDECPAHDGNVGRLRYLERRRRQAEREA